MADQVILNKGILMMIGLRSILKEKTRKFKIINEASIRIWTKTKSTTFQLIQGASLIIART